MASPKERFDLAVDIVTSLPKEGPIQPSQDSRLKFYGYFKQATVGKCNTTQPWVWDVVNKAKWSAWNELGDMSAEEAMTKYAEEFYKGLLENDDGEADPELKAKLNKFKDMMKS